MAATGPRYFASRSARSRLLGFRRWCWTARSLSLTTEAVTHIDALSEAISSRRPERFAYFAFDLLHIDGHDLRRCAIEDRKALLRDVIGGARCERVVYVDVLDPKLFEAVRQAGAEGIVSQRRGSIYRAC
jgi:bifunctional non-homologous end joining protein LigD